jgi:hypothetical protein
MADGELGLVPESTRAHVTGCPVCAEEIASYRLLNDKMLEADARTTPNARKARPRLGLARRTVIAAAAAAFIVALAAGGAVWKASQDEAPIVAAAAAVHQPLQFSSSDTAAIRAWCVRVSNRNMPIDAIPGLAPVGARLDRVAGRDVVSVVYAAPGRGRIAVSWIDVAQATHSEEAVQARSVAGHTVLMVHSPSGTVAVSGDVPMTELWSAAAAVQSISQ